MTHSPYVEHPVRNSAHFSTFLEPNRFKSAQQIGEGSMARCERREEFAGRRERFRCCCTPVALFSARSPTQRAAKATHTGRQGAGRVSPRPCLDFCFVKPTFP